MFCYGYGAPEQYGKSQTDVRADIYGLGATLHHLLTGVNSIDKYPTFTNILEINTRLNGKWQHIITKATKMAPSERYQSATEMKNDLIKLAILISDKTE